MKIKYFLILIFCFSTLNLIAQSNMISTNLTLKEESHVINEIKSNQLLPSYEQLAKEDQGIVPIKKNTDSKENISSKTEGSAEKKSTYSSSSSSKSKTTTVSKNITKSSTAYIAFFKVTSKSYPVYVASDNVVQITAQVKTSAEVASVDYLFSVKRITKVKMYKPVDIFYYPNSLILNGRSQMQFNFNGKVSRTGEKLSKGSYVLFLNVTFKDKNGKIIKRSREYWGKHSYFYNGSDFIYIK